MAAFQKKRKRTEEERVSGEEGGGGGGVEKDYKTGCFYIGNFERQKIISIVQSNKRDFSEPVFKNPGRDIPSKT